MKEWIIILFRSIVLFFTTLIIIRIMGKKQLSKITPFNLLNYIVIGVLVALMSTNIITNFPLGIIALLVWALIPIALDFISMKSKLLQDLINGKEIVLVKEGKIMEENLKQARMTPEQFLRALRSKNAFSLADVEFAQLETTGDINVFLKADKKPVTSYDLGRMVSPQSVPQTVISDGNVLEEPLSNIGLNHAWLETQLENSGVSLDNVFIGQVNSSGELYLDLFDDSIQMVEPKVKQLLYANIEKCHADFMSYSLETQDIKAKTMYSKNAGKLQKIMTDLKPFLLR
ncbi:DUF421 domain-containing protein [Clostridium sp. DJ247]|uniref:DUF421 domain-containing protein n=1 Tax=Clostridium sp. DJ247 TaxID=2726188 RepID=UPI001627D00C|nr:DUF421 domain-containing protein [Clostridium sp. DJ247]MBC2581896.1 DUF421 domain-containing protein [Clostridium sp. DJ247]